MAKRTKEERKEHRQDHFTKHDRKLWADYKGDRKGRVAARKAGYQTDNKTAADFNFDKFGKGHVSQGEMRHLKKQGHSKQDIMDAVNASGYELGGRVKNRFAKWEAKANKNNNQSKTPPANSTPDPQPALDNKAVDAKERAQNFQADSGNSGDVNDSPGAAVDTGNTANTQKDIGNTENDIKTSSGNITSNPIGDNNYSSANIDSSVRTYGGSNRVFNYQGGSGQSSLYDSPVSAATMGGYYDVDDSPAAQAKFVNLHSGINQDNQKRYAGQAMEGALAAIAMNNQLPSVDYEARKAANRQEAEDSKTISNINLFGDRDFAKGYLPDYEFGADPKPIEDPFEKDDDDDDDD
tara:strand:- start:6818 stop:7870 length:1053 start_codon:yes stop_codon:yes gene_type:complete